MGDNWGRHIGDDQLRHGLPKHLEAVASTDRNAYWEIVPGKSACSRRQAMRGRRFLDKPGPVHPNCACEILRVAPQARRKHPQTVAAGTLQGYGDNETERFEAGQVISVAVQNLGPFVTGAWLRVDGKEERTTGHMFPGQIMELEFSKFSEPPVSWVVFLMCIAGDNSTIRYAIYW